MPSPRPEASQPSRASADAAPLPGHLYDLLPAAVFLIEAGTGRILHGNPAAEELSGLPLESLVGRFAVRLFPRSDISRHLDAHAEPPPEGGFLGWIRRRGRTDTAIAARVRAVPRTRPRQYLLVAFDISYTPQRQDRLAEPG